MPSARPMPVISTITTSVPANINTTYSHVRLRLKDLHHTLQQGASSLTSRLTTERCKRRKLRSSFQRTQSNSTPTAPSTTSDEASSSFHRVQQAAKSLFHNLRNRTPIRPTENSLISDSSVRILPASLIRSKLTNTEVRLPRARHQTPWPRNPPTPPAPVPCTHSQHTHRPTHKPPRAQESNPPRARSTLAPKARAACGFYTTGPANVCDRRE